MLSPLDGAISRVSLHLWSVPDRDLIDLKRLWDPTPELGYATTPLLQVLRQAFALPLAVMHAAMQP